MSTESRKKDHILICLRRKVEGFKSTGFEDIEFIHWALPEINEDEIDMSIKFLGRKFDYPILINSMTGGHALAKKVNERLARFASKHNIPMGLGSQRAALENKKIADTYKIARDVAKDCFLIANIGINQVKNYRDKLCDIINMVEANALAIHLNVLQEAIQGEKINLKGILDLLKEIKKELEVPLIIKEVGFGICKEVAKKLSFVDAIDVGGAGGTNFAVIEGYRNVRNANIAKTFASWGIPTALSLLEVVNNVNIPIIASGGIRTGLDVAKSLALGASIAGIALPFLRACMKGEKCLDNYFKKIITEVKVCMLTTNSKNVKDLKRSCLLIRGSLAEMARLRGIDIGRYARRCQM